MTATGTDAPPGRATRVRRAVGERLGDRRPTARQVAGLVAVLMAAVVMVTLLARTADVADVPNLEAPEGFVIAPPPTTAAPGEAAPALPGVAGTTTTITPPNVGTARIDGIVIGPAGPVAGAVVRVERFIAEATQVVDAVAGPDGRYELEGIGGGRYRVRAFRAPAFAQATAELLFLADGEDRALDLTLEGFADPRVQLVAAPNPPFVDQPVNVVVLVSDRVVADDGTVRTGPLPGVTVTIQASGPFTALGPTSGTTDGRGQVAFAFECTAPGSTLLTANAIVALTAPGGGRPPTTNSPGPRPTLPGEGPSVPGAPVTPTRGVSATLNVPTCLVAPPPPSVTTPVPVPPGGDAGGGGTTPSTNPRPSPTLPG
ncbi:MAG: carboxypeptidase-like regulatory domain-containing protein [Acidimicrobiales bacterium]